MNSKTRRMLRNIAIERLGGKCIYCGDTERLEFDHYKGKKKFPISRCTSSNHSTFWREVKKCRLLCHDCHVIRHSKAFQLLVQIKYMECVR